MFVKLGWFRLDSKRSLPIAPSIVSRTSPIMFTWTHRRKWCTCHILSNACLHSLVSVRCTVEKFSRVTFQKHFNQIILESRCWNQFFWINLHLPSFAYLLMLNHWIDSGIEIARINARHIIISCCTITSRRYPTVISVINSKNSAAVR